MHCSCPDWAVPCKHLAAVIYLLSQEIDGDPFLVFSLRGLDLPRLLREQGVHIGKAAAASLPTLAQVAFEEEPSARRDSALPASDPSVLERLTFTAIPDLREPLWQVLPANPVFFRGGDFRELARRVMTRVAKHAREIMDAAVALDDGAPVPEGRLQLLANEQGELAATGVEIAGRALQAWPELLGAVAGVAPARLADLPVEVATLHTLRLMALHLLGQGAVVPQVFAIDANTLGVRWCAAELDGTVHGMVMQVASALPPELVRAAPRPQEAAARARGPGAAAAVGPDRSLRPVRAGRRIGEARGRQGAGTLLRQRPCEVRRPRRRGRGRQHPRMACAIALGAASAHAGAAHRGRRVRRGLRAVDRGGRGRGDAANAHAAGQGPLGAGLGAAAPGRAADSGDAGRVPPAIARLRACRRAQGAGRWGRRSCRRCSSTRCPRCA